MQDDREVPDRGEQLLRLAGIVSTLRPEWRDPERFYEARSAIAAALRRLAAEAEAEAARRVAWRTRPDALDPPAVRPMRVLPPRKARC